MRTIATLAAMTAALSIAPAQAAVYTETQDAGALLPTAIVVPGGTNAIHGSISATDIVDLWGIDVGTAGIIEFQFTTPGEWFDSDITLFNAKGNPIATYDNPTFGQFFQPGRYYIAISDWNIAATDSTGRFIADDYYGVLDTSGVLGGWDITSSPFRYGSYQLTLSVATVPEPNAVMMLGAGLLLAGAAPLARRRKL